MRPQSFRQLADLLVTTSVTYGIIDGGRCRLDVIAMDMINAMRLSNWYLYVLSLDDDIPDDVIMQLSVHDRDTIQTDMESEILGYLIVVDGYIKIEHLYTLL